MFKYNYIIRLNNLMLGLIIKCLCLLYLNLFNNLYYNFYLHLNK